MAHRYTKRQGSVRFTWRKNRIRKRFREHVTSRRGNLIPGLFTAVAVRPRTHLSKQREILDWLIQRKRHGVHAMPLNPTRKSQAVHTQRTGLFWIRVKAKSRSTGKTRRSRSTKCA